MSTIPTVQGISDNVPSGCSNAPAGVLLRQLSASSSVCTLEQFNAVDMDALLQLPPSPYSTGGWNFLWNLTSISPPTCVFVDEAAPNSLASNNGLNFVRSQFTTGCSVGYMVLITSGDRCLTGCSCFAPNCSIVDIFAPTMNVFQCYPDDPSAYQFIVGIIGSGGGTSFGTFPNLEAFVISAGGWLNYALCPDPSPIFPQNYNQICEPGADPFGGDP